MKDKYVCICDIWLRNKCLCGHKINTPKEREIYTVIGLSPRGNYALKEFPKASCGCEFFYAPEFFRPLDDVLSKISLEEVKEVLSTELVEV
jgi:hypothetical protein